MSNALALAAVTAVLKDLLDNALIDHSLSAAMGGSVVVSALPPDRVTEGDGVESSRLNLFLYGVTPNAGWRNECLPSRAEDGARLSNPPLALDLHYLLTAFGAADFQAELLLGYAMQMLHETPVLTRDAIRATLAAPSPVDGSLLPPALQALAAADLADQVEHIKITPQYLTTEEMSKMWSALQTHYRPTVAYQASVVLIESRRSTRSALPVRTRNIRVLPFRQPVIEEVGALDGSGRSIVAGDTLRLTGRNLRGEVTRLRFDAAVIEPTQLDDTELSLPLAAPPLPANALRAGVRSVQVIHQLNLNTPADPHRGFESNVAAFVLRPTLTAVNAPDATRLTIQVNPPVGREQRVVLLLNARSEIAPTAHSFIAAARAADTATLDIAISGVAAGEYFVRLQIDGAESPLDLEPSSPNFGPTVIIP